MPTLLLERNKSALNTLQTQENGIHQKYVPYHDALKNEYIQSEEGYLSNLARLPVPYHQYIGTTVSALLCPLHYGKD